MTTKTRKPRLTYVALHEDCDGQYTIQGVFTSKRKAFNLLKDIILEELSEGRSQITQGFRMRGYDGNDLRFACIVEPGFGIEYTTGKVKNRERACSSIGMFGVTTYERKTI